LETATSNIAIQSKTGEWITPILNREKTPFLDGVMRRYLLEQGVIRQGELTLRDYEEAKRDGRRVIGFNGLRLVFFPCEVGVTRANDRGVWEAELL